MLSRLKKMFLITAMFTTLVAAPLGTALADSTASIKSDADTAFELGLLIGDGYGMNDAYLNKASTRMQAAIISLRLNGKLKEAQSYTGKSNFSDAAQVSKANQSILAYLKNKPELGWQGPGNNRFEPSAAISSKQFYKVILENLGYQTGSDFTYQKTEAFAASHGLNQIAGTGSLLNASLATALVEALSADTMGGKLFFDSLQSSGVIAAGSSLPQGERIVLGKNDKQGTFFTDKNGRTLYFFTKDAENVNACQADCLKNWPIYYDEHLQIPASLNKDDFAVITRSDGRKQLTYKNWPLYYFIQDTQHGDMKGQGINDVWFTVDPVKFKGTTASTPAVKTYTIDIKELSFGKEPLTVEAGSKVTFTNYDDMKHNAVALDGSFSTPLLDKGESYTITLDKPGTVNYYCEPHKTFMTGQIIVK